MAMTKFFRLATGLLVAMGICLPAFTTQAETQELSSFTVLAEPTLTLPLSEITRVYSVRKRLSILTEFANSKSHAFKIQEGESGDVLITSMPDTIYELKQRGLIDVFTQSTVATNRLMLVSKPGEDTGSKIAIIKSLEKRPVLLASPDNYIEGVYGRLTFNYLFSRQLPPTDPHVYTNSQALYDAIRHGEGVGIVLETEALRTEGLECTIPLADNSYPPIVYQAVVIAGESMPQARDFLTFLKSEEAQEIFANYGFRQP